MFQFSFMDADYELWKLDDFSTAQLDSPVDIRNYTGET